MGWGLILKEVYLSRIRKSELEDTLEENNKIIRMYEDELIALAVYIHPSIKDGEQDGEEVSLVDYAPTKIRNITEALCELYNKNYLIQIAIDNPEDIIEDN